jgi:hypothetical protein
MVLEASVSIKRYVYAMFTIQSAFSGDEWVEISDHWIWSHFCTATLKRIRLSMPDEILTMYIHTQLFIGQMYIATEI